jgi:hypothetical protein
MKSRIVVVVIALLAALGVACDPWAQSPQATHYELIGGHAVAECSSCHPTDEVAPAATDCESCHLDVMPEGHFSGQCAQCHTPLGWGQFLHQFFPLENTHDLSCDSCHVGEVYSGLTSDCESCHAELEPLDHFDGPCADCHKPTTWLDADFNHNEVFPIPHEGNGACIDCHTTGDNSTFECIECHEHGKAKMDDEHQGEAPNYEWNSKACLDCHPRGKE